MVTVRRVTLADVEALTPLKAEVHALHVEAHPEVFKAMSDEDVARWLRDRLGEEPTHAWLAEVDAVLLGYAMAAQRERGETTYSHARAWCEIDEVIVAAGGRRRAPHTRRLGRVARDGEQGAGGLPPGAPLLPGGLRRLGGSSRAAPVRTARAARRVRQ